MITDDKGNKIPQLKINKKTHSANIRTQRTTRIVELSKTEKGQKKINKNICTECGFKIRSENHVEGDHHLGRVPVCRR